MNCKYCNTNENIVKSGLIRGEQRYYCKRCGKNFSLITRISERAKKSHQTTIIDVAKKLGIAPSTVSRALNNKTEINVQTRELIIKTALEMDYRPNLLAQSLNSGETHTIGVIIPNIERPYFAGVLAGIQSVASKAGYRVMICQSNESHQMEVLNTQALVNSRVDGLLISHSKETQSFDHLMLPLNRGLPIVHFDRVAPSLPTSKIILQDQEGAYQLIYHLIKQGYKRIAVLSGPENLLICQRRLLGFKQAMMEAKLPIDQNLIAHSSFDKEEILRIFDQWMELTEPPEAIFAVFYNNAIDMSIRAKKMGIKIPNELAFVGFGDEPMAELIEPSLTAFHLFPHRVGEQAAQLLINHIINKDQPKLEEICIIGELRVRQSSLPSEY